MDDFGQLESCYGTEGLDLAVRFNASGWEVPMRVSLSDVSLWFDVSGPSILPQGETVVERPTVVTVHGGPGWDHINLKASLAPLTEHMQVIYYDQRGHGRSDLSSPEFWNLRTWADDLRRLCDTLGLAKPVVLGTSFGGFVALAYAALFPGHPGGIILANTTGRADLARSVEIFRRLGGDHAAAVAQRDFTELSEESAAEFERVCRPLYSGKPGYAEELRQGLARVHPRPSTWTCITSARRHRGSTHGPLCAMVKCPVLILAGEDDPMCPLPVVEDLASQLSAGTTSLVRLPGARHTIFRDRPDLAFPAIEDFIRRINSDSPSS